MLINIHSLTRLLFINSELHDIRNAPFETAQKKKTSE